MPQDKTKETEKAAQEELKDHSNLGNIMETVAREWVDVFMKSVELKKAFSTMRERLHELAVTHVLVEKNKLDRDLFKVASAGRTSTDGYLHDMIKAFHNQYESLPEQLKPVEERRVIITADDFERFARAIAQHVTSEEDLEAVAVEVEEWRKKFELK